MKRFVWSLIALVLVAVAVAPAAAQFDRRFDNVVRGQVAWAGRPPAGSILQVFVFDLTDPQYPEIVADRAINNVVGAPVPFEIVVDRRRIDPNRTYGVMARIIYGNPPAVAFENRQAHYVLTRGRPNTVTIQLQNVLSGFPGPGRPGDGPGRRFGRGRVTGTITFRERGLPPRSILQVFLFDLTNPQAPYIIVDKAIENFNDSPVSFDLRFDPRRIDAGHVYGIHARIIYGTPPAVWLTTRRPEYVLTRGNDNNVEVRLRRPREF
jgi:uncharacterized lipoprotein YbaY